MCRCWESCWTWRRERKKNSILAETQDSDAKTKKGVDKIIRLSYNKCRWFKQTGEMAEWFMALVLKTSDTVRYRGFESLSLRKRPEGRLGCKRMFATFFIFGVDKFVRSGLKIKVGRMAGRRKSGVRKVASGPTEGRTGGMR